MDQYSLVKTNTYIMKNKSVNLKGEKLQACRYLWIYVHNRCQASSVGHSFIIIALY